MEVVSSAGKWAQSICAPKQQVDGPQSGERGGSSTFAELLCVVSDWVGCSSQSGAHRPSPGSC